MKQFQNKLIETFVPKDNEAFENIEQLIMIDSLTKLPNYYYFKDVFDRKWRSAVRKQEPISLIIFDFDHLGLFNDQYGFAAGDETLKKIANKIKSMLHRPDDFLAHYEGGKFILILPETNMNGALQVGERLRLGIENMKIPHSLSSTSKYVTLSFGIGTKSPYVWEDPQLFIKAVEQAMHTAKQNGRNQVIWSNVFIHQTESD
ncbi:diguanylate cyclase [Calidifontibacillus oryziterrae]|uniref:diguanylate cyclase n=1 Tax=Calidifontibacillus oryziterrae TaxID=1191699 RepID=UPI0002EE0221|nr:diguanylate cyclase [Calidifontibacillus oryziterrae]